MDASAVADQQLQEVQASYARCQQAAEFFRAFYDRLLASDPAIPPYFAKTRFDKQEKLLQHGISLLLIFARRPNPALLSRLADRHGSAGLNIPHALYPLFVDALVATVRQFDSQAGPATLEAWRAVMTPGIAFIMGRGR